MYILIIKGVSVQNINEIYEKFLLDYSIVVRYMYMLDAESNNNIPHLTTATQHM